MSTLFLRFFEFQSTLPRGSDVFIMFSSLYSKNFNPRSLAGATMGLPVQQAYMVEFQSTLPRGSDISLVVSVSVAV